MNISELNKKFGTQEQCVKHLEQLRWGKQVACPYCKKSDEVFSYKDVARHRCYRCNSNFSVFVGTVFEENRLPLPQFFQVIMLMLNAPQGISAKVLAKNAGIPYKTSWYTAMRIRCGMVEQVQNLRGTIEMDEMYISGKPANLKKTAKDKPVLNKISTQPPKRGRGTSKIKVAGLVERKGKVVARIMDEFNSYNMLQLLRKHVNEQKATVITDNAKFYYALDKEVEHKTINKSKEGFAKGTRHTNTIEGFWSIIEAGIKGNYRSLSQKYLPFYLTEFCYKYNRRNKKGNKFDDYLKNALSDTNCLVNFKPKQAPRRLVLKKRKLIIKKKRTLVRKK